MRLYLDEIEQLAQRAGEYFDDELLDACDLASRWSTAPQVREVLLEYIAFRLDEWDEGLEQRAWRDRCRDSEAPVELEPMRLAA